MYWHTSAVTADGRNRDQKTITSSPCDFYSQRAAKFRSFPSRCARRSKIVVRAASTPGRDCTRPHRDGEKRPPFPRAEEASLARLVTPATSLGSDQRGPRQRSMSMAWTGLGHSARATKSRPRPTSQFRRSLSMGCCKKPSWSSVLIGEREPLCRRICVPWATASRPKQL